MRNAALQYAERGLYVHPLHYMDRLDGELICSCKDPRPSKGTNHKAGKHPASWSGIKDASVDAERIERDWRRAWNIAVACGLSNLFVIDFDPRNGGDVSYKLLGELVPEELVMVPTVETGGGGVHLWFAAPERFPKLPDLAGVDYQMDMKSAIAPPSIHETGRKYRWRDGHSLDDLDLPQFTDTMLQALWKIAELEAPAEPAVTFRAPLDDGSADFYPEGRRNSELFKWGTRHRRGYDTSQNFQEALQQANQDRCQPPLPDDEVLAMAERIWSYADSGSSRQVNNPAALSKAQTRFLGFDDLLELPPVDWLVEGVIEAGSLVLLSGAPGSFKTFIALDLACRVAGAQATWRTDKPINKHGPVLYLCGEGGGGFRDRLVAWAEFNGRAENFVLTFDPVRLTNSAEVLGMIAQFQTEHGAPLLIVVDTLARAVSGADENSAKDMGTAIAICAQIQALTGATLILVHHPPKNEAHGYRGSSVIEGAVDTRIEVSRVNEKLQCTVSCRKQKNAAPFEDFAIRLDNAGSSLVVDPTPAAITARANYAEQCFEALITFPDGSARYSEWQKASNLSNSPFGKGIDALLVSGRVFKDGLYYRAVIQDVAPEGASGVTEV